jgi:hypothetical protein
MQGYNMMQNEKKNPQDEYKNENEENEECSMQNSD